jgi:C-terminal processing protease CtpA/Prc
LVFGFLPAQPREGARPSSTRTSSSALHLKRSEKDDPLTMTKQPVRFAAKAALSSVTALSLLFEIGSTPLESRAFDGIQTKATTSSVSPAVRQSLASGEQYWSIMLNHDDDESKKKQFFSLPTAHGPSLVEQCRRAANEALADYAVGTINTMYYDHSGGIDFNPRDFYQMWRSWKHSDQREWSTREGTVVALKDLVHQLNDPFSQYLTRQELQQELAPKGTTSNGGLLGAGVLVETPDNEHVLFGSAVRPPQLASLPSPPPNFESSKSRHVLLSVDQIQHLPVVSAVVPDSSAERAGITVGDRIVSVGPYSFRGRTPDGMRKLLSRCNSLALTGDSTLVVAQPVAKPDSRTVPLPVAFLHDDADASGVAETDSNALVVAYRPARVTLAPSGPWFGEDPSLGQRSESLRGGDSTVHYSMLSSLDSIFDRADASRARRVGYIRFTRFSKASTAGYLRAVKAQEAGGADSYIIDLRNNYGGIIQEAMLTASTLIRDPNAVLCYTMNSRGGFTPHDVEEYVVDTRYPGYLLSHESKDVTRQLVQRNNPAILKNGGRDWVAPSSYSSLHEQAAKRNSKIGASSQRKRRDEIPLVYAVTQQAAQKNIVLLVNEGTASAAEVFASALHDNGRIVAMVGTRTYGKGLIQHTFPMPDGGGLRLTVAEYLTPALRHVTHVGSARYDRITGNWVGGGIEPDVRCSSSRAGIPADIGADLCVGTALDLLKENENNSVLYSTTSLLAHQHHRDFDSFISF